MSCQETALARARSFLFVPGHRLERLGKALASGAHAVIVDLEDAVAPQDKPAAREALARAIETLPNTAQPRLLVRINAPHTEWHAADLALLGELAGHLAAVVLPKAEAVAAIADVAHAAAAPVLALIESAAGLDALDLVARTPQVQRLAFGHLDFQSDLGMDVGADQRELDSVRLALALASRRAGLPPPVDGVTVALEDESALAADIARSRRFGFGGKLCIHPQQVAAVNEGPARPRRSAPGETCARRRPREWARRLQARRRDDRCAGGAACPGVPRLVTFFANRLRRRRHCRGRPRGIRVGG